MVEPKVLERLLAGETDRIEYKRSISQRDNILKAACALANDLGNSQQPGYVVIGVDNRGEVVGVGTSGELDSQQKELADRLRSSKIQPIPSTTVTPVPVHGLTILVVEVEPYRVPPIVAVDRVAWVCGWEPRLAWPTMPTFSA